MEHAPFDTLVLPEGYKDLILSFVESQLKDGLAFDDVITARAAAWSSCCRGSRAWARR